MLDMVVSFLQEQGILILMGMLLVGGIWGQVMASLRFRKLRKGLQALVPLPVREENRENTAEDSPWEDFNTQREAGVQSPVIPRMTVQESTAQQSDTTGQAGGGSQIVSDADRTGEADSRLLYLKQSLDRIAAGRDQKMEEEPKGHRKLTPAEEQMIADILTEYLS